MHRRVAARLRGRRPDRRPRARWGAAVGALFLVSFAGSAVAQGPENPNGRRLNGHLFIPSIQIADPFITTDLGNQVGVGTARNVSTLILDLDDNPIVLTGDVTFLGLGFAYQQAISSWLAARLSVSGLGRLGTDVESLLSTGISATASIDIGAQARIWRNKHFFLSGSLDYQSNGITEVNVLSWVRQVVDSGDLTDSLLVTSESSGTFVGGLNLAYSPAAWLGLTGLLRSGIGEGYGDLDARFVYTAGLKADVDFKEFGFIPIGASAFFKSSRLAQRTEDYSDTIETFGGGLFFTGEEDFSVGLEYSFATLPTDIGPEVDLSMIQLNLKYFFGQ